MHIFIRNCLLQSNIFKQKSVWHHPSHGFLSNCLFAWVMTVVFCRQIESWVFNFNKSLRWELSKKKKKKKVGLEWICLQLYIRVVFIEVSTLNAGACMEESGRISNSQILPSHKCSKVPSHLWGMWSVITPNSANCFHTLPNIDLPQMSPFVIPVADGVMAGAS